MAFAWGLHVGLICLKRLDLLTMEVLSQSAALTEIGKTKPQAMLTELSSSYPVLLQSSVEA